MRPVLFALALALLLVTGCDSEDAETAPSSAVKEAPRSAAQEKRVVRGWWQAATLRAAASSTSEPDADEPKIARWRPGEEASGSDA